jgi:hypothetical protein
MEPPDFKGSSPDRTRLQLGSAIPVLCTIGSAAINDTKYMHPQKKLKEIFEEIIGVLCQH